jgi:hypothetical protein
VSLLLHLFLLLWPSCLLFLQGPPKITFGPWIVQDNLPFSRSSTWSLLQGPFALYDKIWESLGSLFCLLWCGRPEDCSNSSVPTQNRAIHPYTWLEFCSEYSV